MAFPAFFDQAPVIQMRDPLAALLGASEDGLIEYHYSDAVRLAGHSCPTVAGAFLMGRAALNALYPKEAAERGNIAVSMSAPEDQGTTGVIAQVLTLITGAAANNGFRGIGGWFARNHLLSYAAIDNGDSSAATFQRRDNGAEVTVRLDVSSVPADPDLQPLMMAVMQNQADAEQIKAFGNVWQARVQRLLLQHADDPEVLRVTHH